MKKILLAIVGIILLGVITIGLVSFLSPTEFQVEREVVINKPKAEVFEYLRFLKNQNEWGPWVKRDPNIKLTYSGDDGKPGFISKWESEHEQVGHGEQEIKKIADGKRIDTELRFIKPWESKSNGYFITEDAGDGKTTVKWGFTGSMPRPMNLMLLVTPFEAEVGKDFDEGLSALKAVVEKRESPNDESDDAKKDDGEKDGEDKDDKSDKGDGAAPAKDGNETHG